MKPDIFEILKEDKSTKGFSTEDIFDAFMAADPSAVFNGYTLPIYLARCQKNHHFGFSSQQLMSIFNRAKFHEDTNNNKHVSNIRQPLIFHILQFNKSSQLNLNAEQILSLIKKSDLKYIDQYGNNIALELAMHNVSQHINLSKEQFFEILEQSDLNHQNRHGNTLASILLQCLPMNKFLSADDMFELLNKTDLKQSFKVGNYARMLINHTQYSFSSQQITELLCKCDLNQKINHISAPLVIAGKENLNLSLEQFQKILDSTNLNAKKKKQNVVIFYLTNSKRLNLDRCEIENVLQISNHQMQVAKILNRTNVVAKPFVEKFNALVESIKLKQDTTSLNPISEKPETSPPRFL